MPRFPYATTRLLAAALFLAAAASCKKDNPAPSNTTLLTGPTWRATDVRLTVNGVEGTATLTGSAVTDSKFTADGKYTTTPAGGGTASTGTWVFASNETQLIQTPTGGSPGDPAQLITLTSTDLAIGRTYSQTQVQHAINNNTTSPTETDRLILALILSSGSFTFTGGSSPVSSASQITSLGVRFGYKAR